MKLLKITDGKAGHSNCSESYIKCIASVAPEKHLEVDTLHVRLRLKGLLRLLRFVVNSETLLNIAMRFNCLLHLVYVIDAEQTVIFENYDFIVSSGGDTAFANIYLAKKYGIRNVYASRLRGLHPQLFFLLPTMNEREVFKNSIFIEFPPTDKESPDNEKILKFKREINMSGDKVFSLLIGGDGSGYYYEPGDYQRIIDIFLESLSKYNAYGLLTTSRRTGIKNEKTIQNFILNHKHRSRLKYCIYYNSKPEKLLDVYFAISDVVFVTEESGAMLTESILSNKAIYTMRPRQILFNSTYDIFLKSRVKYIKSRINIFDENELNVCEGSESEVPSPTLEFQNKLKIFLQERGCY